MKRHVKILLALLLTIGACGSVDAALIGSFTDGGGFGGNKIFNIADFDFEVGEDPFAGNPLFDSLMVSLSDVGKEFFATSCTGPSPDLKFDEFVSFLTNGEDGMLWSMHFSPNGGGGGTGKQESAWFGTSPDFQGYNIEAFGLIINELNFSSPGKNPNLDGVWTDVLFNLTFNVYDTYPIPEPATMLLLGTGLVGLAIVRRRFKKYLPTKLAFSFLFMIVFVLGIPGLSNSTPTELTYDDGEWDFGWGTGPVGGGAVLFTPPTTPWILSAIQVNTLYGRGRTLLYRDLGQ